jgi:hypothetical protein
MKMKKKKIKTNTELFKSIRNMWAINPRTRIKENEKKSIKKLRQSEKKSIHTDED